MSALFDKDLVPSAIFDTDLVPLGEFDHDYATDTSVVLYSSYHERIVNQTPGVQSFWEMQDTVGATSVVDSVGSVTGALDTSGGSVTFGAPPLLADPSVKSVRLNKGILEFGDVYDFAGTNSFTFECWVKINVFPTGGFDSDFMGKAQYSPSIVYESQLYIQSNGVTVLFNRDAQSTASKVVNWNTGDVHHVVATYDGTTKRLYIDGQLAGSAGDITSITDQPLPYKFRIGGNYSSAGYLDGWVSHAAVYNRALTPAEIYGNYQQGLYVPPPSDTATVGLALTPSASESYQSVIIDSATEVFALTPSSLDVRLYSSYHDRIVNHMSGVQSFWEMQEASGATTSADSKASVTGTVVTTNGPVTFGDPGLIVESGSKSVRLAKGRLEYGDVYDPIGLAPYTWEAWIKMNTFPTSTNRGDIISKYLYGLGTDVNQFYLDSTLLGAVRNSQGLGSYVPGWSTGQVHHVVVTADPGVSAAKLYIDGVLVSTVGCVGSVNDTAYIFRVGGGAVALQSFDGWVSHVAVYNRALTADEVYGNYQQGLFNPPITDAATETFSLTPSAVETQQFVEVGTAAVLLVVSGVDVYEVHITQDSAIEPLALTPSAVIEARVSTDASTEAFTLTPSDVQTAQFVDAVTEVFALTPSGVDIKAKEYVESATEVFALTPSSVEIAQFIDTSTESFVFTPSTVIETREISDAATELFALTPSGADVYTVGGTIYTDAAVEAFALTPSAGELREITDSAIETFKFTPSGSDVYTPSVPTVDTATGAFLLTPSSVEVYTPSVPTIDAVTEVFNLIPSSIDIAQFTDAATEVFNLTPIGTELIAVVDAVVEQFNFTISATELSQFVDAAIESLLITPSGTEFRGVQTLDSGMADFKITASTVVEVVTEVDAATVGLVLTPSSVVETEQFVDANTTRLTFTPITASESTGAGALTTDAATVGLAFTPTSADVPIYVDSNQLNLLFNPSSAETYGRADASTEVFALTPSGTESSAAAIIDAATETLSITPSSIDQFAGVDTTTELFHFTPSATEVYTTPTVDTTTALLQLVPSGVDVYVPVSIIDTATVRLSFTPTTAEAAVFVDVSTINFNLVPGGIEVPVTTDAVTALLKLSPAVGPLVEVGVFVDSGIVRLNLVPSAVEVYLQRFAIGISLRAHSVQQRNPIGVRHLTVGSRQRSLAGSRPRLVAKGIGRWKVL